MNPLRLLLPLLLCPAFLSRGDFVIPLAPETHPVASNLRVCAGITASVAPTAERTTKTGPAFAPTTTTVAALTDREDDKFAFGKIIAVGAHSVVVREYDFARDADEDVRYWITAETELGRIESLADLAVGDDVVIDYTEIGDARVVTTLLREEKDGSDGLPGVSGTVVAIAADAITVRHYNWSRDAEAEVRYVVTGDTELRFADALGDLAAGDEVEIDFVEVDGLRGAVSLARITGGETAEAAGPANELGFPCVVTLVDGEGVRLRVTNPALAAVVPDDYSADPELVLLNGDSMADVRPGDRLDVVFNRIEGRWVIVGVARVLGP